MPAHPACLHCTPCARHRSQRVSAGSRPIALHLAPDAVERVIQALHGYADGLAMQARQSSPEADHAMIADSVACHLLAGLLRRNVPTAA